MPHPPTATAWTALLLAAAAAVPVRAAPPAAAPAPVAPLERLAPVDMAEGSDATDALVHAGLGALGFGQGAVLPAGSPHPLAQVASADGVLAAAPPGARSADGGGGAGGGAGGGGAGGGAPGVADDLVALGVPLLPHRPAPGCCEADPFGLRAAEAPAPGLPQPLTWVWTFEQGSGSSLHREANWLAGSVAEAAGASWYESAYRGLMALGALVGDGALAEGAGAGHAPAGHERLAALKKLLASLVPDPVVLALALGGLAALDMLQRRR